MLKFGGSKRKLNECIATMALCQIYPHHRCVFLVIASCLCWYDFGKWATICTKMATMDIPQLIIFFPLFFQEFAYRAYLVLLGTVLNCMRWGFVGFFLCLFFLKFQTGLLSFLLPLWLYKQVAGGHFSDALMFRNIMHLFNIIK